MTSVQNRQPRLSGNSISAFWGAFLYYKCLYLDVSVHNSFVQNIVEIVNLGYPCH